MSGTPATGEECDFEAASHVRFNFAVLVGDVSCFVIGSAFLDSATALPALVTRLGGGAALLGIMGAIRQGAYYLPQLFVAHRLEHAKRYQPILLWITFFGRIGYFFSFLGILLLGKARPDIALGLLTLAYTLAWLGDGGGGVPWTALVGRTIPARQRGGLFATTQAVSGVGKLGVGALVVLLLSGKWVRFPVADSLLVLGCALFMAISWVFLALIREPVLVSGTEKEEPVNKTSGFLDYAKTLPARLRARPDFGRLALVQILATTSVATAPFLWGFLRNSVPGGLPEGDAGKFLVAQTVGLLVFAPVWGLVSDHYGPKLSLTLLIGLSLLWPAMALAGKMLGGNIFLFYLAYFFLGGVVENWITITNYLLESVPEQDQPAYIGLMNAASLPSLVLPLIAGGVAQRFGEGTSVLLAAVFLGIGLIAVRTLPETRR